MTQVPLHKVKDNLSRYIDQAAEEEVLVTRHGRPAASQTLSLATAADELLRRMMQIGMENAGATRGS